MRILKLLIVFIIVPSVVFAHRHFDYDDEDFANEVIVRESYISNLEIELKQLTNKHISISLYGEELEHILIVSPACSQIAKHHILGAHQVGVLSIKCRWFNYLSYLPFN